MRKITFNQTFMKLFTLITLGFAAFGFTGSLGLDSYEIYLNNKLLMKQSVNQPLSLRVLQLAKVDDKDLLRITYTHCSVKGAGTGRSIVLKDEKGNALKKWSFADAAGADPGMVIPVKELQQLEKGHPDQELSLQYAAKELPKAEMLAALRFK